MTNDKSDFTQGSISKKAGCFYDARAREHLILQAAYGAVDLLVVGRFGSTAGLSAVSTGSQVLNLVTFVVDSAGDGCDRPDCPLPGRKNARSRSARWSAAPRSCSH